MLNLRHRNNQIINLPRPVRQPPSPNTALQAAFMVSLIMIGPFWFRTDVACLVQTAVPALERECDIGHICGFPEYLLFFSIGCMGQASGRQA